MSKKQRKVLIRIIISSVLLVAAVAAEHLVLKNSPQWLLLFIFLVPYFVIGHDVLKKSLINIKNGQAFDENLLMSIATIGALAIGFFPNTEPQYPEAVLVMLLYQIGELFQSIAVGKSRKQIAELLDIRPDVAYIESDGNLLEVAAETVEVGQLITVLAGEKIPLDGVITDGNSEINTVALTGESMPKSVTVGDTVFSGCVNMCGVLTIKVQKSFHESTASKILELVENSSDNKSKSEDFITKFARVYTPAVVMAALLVAILPPLVLSGGFLVNFPNWLVRALTFLIISCPCALVISVPLSFFGGIGGASKKGILIKGSAFLETLSAVRTVVFDKTGTLTKGTFSVTEIHGVNIQKAELLRLAAHAEGFSSHPIAKSIREAYGGHVNLEIVADANEISGLGIAAVVDGDSLLVGNRTLMEKNKIVDLICDKTGTTVHVAKNGEYIGFLIISDSVKCTSMQAIAELKENGVEKTVMLTGDRQEVAQAVAKELAIDSYRAEMLPADKVDVVEELLNSQQKNHKLAFVGDGINDAPVLVRSDVGIAMGALGSDAAIEAADVVLMDDDPKKIAEAIMLSRKTIRIVRQNIVIALIVKGAVLLLGTFGFAPLLAAVFADVGVAFIAILNAMRTLKC